MPEPYFLQRKGSCRPSQHQEVGLANLLSVSTSFSEWITPQRCKVWLQKASNQLSLSLCCSSRFFQHKRCIDHHTSLIYSANLTSSDWITLKVDRCLLWVEKSSRVNSRINYKTTMTNAPKISSSEKNNQVFSSANQGRNNHERTQVLIDGNTNQPALIGNSDANYRKYTQLSKRKLQLTIMCKDSAELEEFQNVTRNRQAFFFCSAALRQFLSSDWQA